MKDTGTLHQSIQSLNTPDAPYVFEMTDATIVGRWNITNSRWFAPGAVRDTEQNYRITVTLDPQTGTYATNEVLNTTHASAGISGLGYRKEVFSGKVFMKSYEAGVGREKSQPDTSLGAHSVSFDTNTIKTPLFNALAQQGWAPKRGGLPVAAIIGIVIGAFFFIGGLTVALIFAL